MSYTFTYAYIYTYSYICYIYTLLVSYFPHIFLSALSYFNLSHWFRAHDLGLLRFFFALAWPRTFGPSHVRQRHGASGSTAASPQLRAARVACDCAGRLQLGAVAIRRGLGAGWEFCTAEILRSVGECLVAAELRADGSDSVAAILFLPWKHITVAGSSVLWFSHVSLWSCAARFSRLNT